jgi:hypothetical protein
MPAPLRLRGDAATALRSLPLSRLTLLMSHSNAPWYPSYFLRDYTNGLNSFREPGLEQRSRLPRDLWGAYEATGNEESLTHESGRSSSADAKEIEAK